MDKVKSEHELAEDAISKQYAEKAKTERIGVGEVTEFTKLESDDPPLPVEIKKRDPESGEFVSSDLAPEPPAETPELTAPEPVAPELAAPEPAPVPQTVRVKVDGQEFDVPKEEIDKAGNVALFQMQVATAKRLKELNDTTNALNARLKALQQPPAPVVPPPDQVEERRKNIEAIRFGSEEEAMAAITELTKPVPQIPVDQVVTSVTRRIEWDNAIKGFVQDMGDLIRDPDIQGMALAREKQLTQWIVKSGRWPSDINAAYKAISADIKAKIGKSPVPSQTRQDRKEALSEPRTAAVRQEGPPLVKTKTPSEVVAEEAKSRGQRIH